MGDMSNSKSLKKSFVRDQSEIYVKNTSEKWGRESYGTPRKYLKDMLGLSN